MLTSLQQSSQRHLSDGELWDRARQGSADAFGVLFERHASAIYSFCFRRVADWSVAEDLTSIVFLEAWRRREKAISPDMVRAWLFGIATNVVRNQRRSQRRYRAALARVPREPLASSFADESDARMSHQQEMAIILAAVGKLPRREQDVLALCVWSGLSYEEAAAALAVPVGTIRSRLSRAKQHLGTHLAGSDTYGTCVNGRKDNND